MTLILRNFLPGRVNEAMRRVLNADSLFSSGVDVEKRREYEQRARST